MDFELNKPYDLQRAFNDNRYWCKNEISSIFIELTCTGLLQALGIKGGWKTTVFKQNGNDLYAVQLEVGNSKLIDQIFIHYQMNRNFKVYAVTNGIISEVKRNLFPGEIINTIHYLINGRMTTFINTF